MASSAGFSRKVWHWLPSLLVWRITDIPATCTSLSVFLVLTLPSCNICLFPSSLYLLIYLLFCLHLPLFLSLLFSSLTSMINWMVFDYYMAVRLTAINWIESQSISFTSLSLPCLCLSLSLAPLFISLSFSFLFVMFFVFFIPLVLLCPCFSCLHYFLSVSFSLSLHSCSFLLSLPVFLLSFIFFLSVSPVFFPCPPAFFALFHPTCLCWLLFILSSPLTLYLSAFPLLFICLSCPPPPSPFLGLSPLQHCDTVVMVTPIIFWHEWRILYWWDGMAEREREKGTVMERKTKTDGKKGRNHWQRKSEWYGNDCPRCLRDKTIPPCNLLSNDESKRTLQIKARWIFLRGLG